MTERRKFIKQAGYGGLSVVLMSHLLTSCKAKSRINPLIIPKGSGYKMSYLTDTVGYFTEKGGTIMWMVDKEGIAVVDTQFPDTAVHLIDRLKSISDRRVDILINTHHHGDHTAGNIAFKDLTDVIIAHENSRTNQENNAKENDTMATTLLPNNTFKNNYAKVVGSENITMNYFGAAHTNGDIIVHFENANVVHMGDLVFNRRFPYIDKGTGASIQNWIKVLDSALSTYDDNTKFVWGHAADGYDVKGGKEDIKAFQNYLEKLMEFGVKCVKEGKSAEAVIASTQVIPGAEQWTGKGIERSITAVFEELK